MSSKLRLLYHQIRRCSSLSVPSVARVDSSILDKCDEDVSDYVLNTKPSFNFAAYVDRSETLQEFVKLGVDLSRIENKRGASEVILKLNFERDVKPFLLFLHDNGVATEALGKFVTQNPFIFVEDLDNLTTRVHYLKSKLFTPEAISRILTLNPRWLSHTTTDIDNRLGFFQNHFQLTGTEVRFVSTRMPKLVTTRLRHVEEVKFSVKEEMGFSEAESKEVLLNKPKVYTLPPPCLVSRFDFIHNEMQIPHSIISRQPTILLYRLSRIQPRHWFLRELKRNVYDPTAPGYVSLEALVGRTDAEFCENVAHCSVVTYNKFLKSL